MGTPPFFSGIDVYIGCSPKDQLYLKRLRIHLKPMEAEGLIKVWDENSILPGARRSIEIARVIVAARVAVLLISADLLASPEFADDILPHILEKVRLNEMIVLSVIIGHSEFQYSSLALYHQINDPAQPLKTMGEGKQEMVWQAVAQAIRAIQQEEQKKNKDVASLLSRSQKTASVMSTFCSKDTKPVLEGAFMEMNGSEMVQLAEAVMHAYPSTVDLKLLIGYELHENIEVIAAGSNLSERVYNLVTWAIASGKERMLFDAAVRRNPGNPRLRAFAMEHGL